MPKRRGSSSERDREFAKRQRERRKREKAALKRERRENKKGAPMQLTPDVVRDKERDAQGASGRDASSSLPDDSESEPDADVGPEDCTG